MEIETTAFNRSSIAPEEIVEQNMTIECDQTITTNFEEASRREWLETNGMGGYASSTISGANTRRYHGLLVAATAPPVGRTVLLSKLDETIIDGQKWYELSSNIFDNTVHPQGYSYLKSFKKHFFPEFTYQCAGIILKKTVAALNGENTTVIMYEVLEADSPFTLRLLPLIAGRHYHHLQQKKNNFELPCTQNDGNLKFQFDADSVDLYVHYQNADFHPAPEWYQQFVYPVEKFRGLDHTEDLYSPGNITATLEAGQKFGIIISTDDHTGSDAESLINREQTRREKLFVGLAKDDAITRQLCLAADQFIVKRGEYLRSIIAGYHWFTDWGRDTMIALPGICLTSGRFEDARKILRAFAGKISNGMLPNRFSDDDDTPEYNTADATLWFFIAIYKYWQFTGDFNFVKAELLPKLDEIIEWHDNGTRHNIQIDEDGLFFAGERGVQLTWMDAKVGGWVVTPRYGKPVEINALWYNALCVLAELHGFANEHEKAQFYRSRSQQVRTSFLEKFWNPKKKCLYDYIDRHISNEAVRPNQIFALSLPFPLLHGEQAEQVLAIVEEKLLTPYGLRSLAQDEPAYRSFYGGNQENRDSSYHQGTVWSWLMGAYITSLIRVRGYSGKQQARTLVQHLVNHLSDIGIGSISEIFGAEAPHRPRGCIAQAWSVGELFRVYVEELD